MQEILLEIGRNPDDVIATSAGPNENNRYSGLITRPHHDQPLIETPFYFKTSELARYFMGKIIEFAEAFNGRDEEMMGWEEEGHLLYFLTLNQEHLDALQDTVQATMTTA